MPVRRIDWQQLGIRQQPDQLELFVLVRLLPISAGSRIAQSTCA